MRLKKTELERLAESIFLRILNAFQVLVANIINFHKLYVDILCYLLNSPLLQVL